MIGRAAVKPIFVGLGTAAVLAAGGASAIANETPSPSPSDTGTPSPAPGKLIVIVQPLADSVDAGKSVDIKTTIEADGGNAENVKVTNITASLKGTTIAGACGAPFDAAACSTEDLASGEKGTVASTVKVPKKGADKTAPFTVEVTVKAADIDPTSDTTTIKYIVPPPPTEPTKTPTKSPTKSPDDPPDKPSPTGSSGSGSGGSGGGSGGSDGGGGSGGSSGGGAGGDAPSVSGGGAVPPQPNSSFDATKPEVALPPIQAPNPSVAPNQSAGVTPQSRLQGNEAPVAQDLTFERMASTQIAWLAALLVAFSLLLTQVRLGRRRLRPAGAARRVKGTHRRPRKGMFGK
ncbi:hypothetical protein [Actinomadura sp. 7K507]|uniref:hypothetical protein n=1 Tax=Actinomadura sp. 7K507 TaxID=2530365 RepID=UPI0010486962|nr:hypothetical protein [Actinomadura sp. 7K507]TDC78359.1 hypothetical protein E1285_37530 [Actinomadura sp. 7K507]